MIFRELHRRQELQDGSTERKRRGGSWSYYMDHGRMGGCGPLSPHPSVCCDVL